MFNNKSKLINIKQYVIIECIKINERGRVFLRSAYVGFDVNSVYLVPSRSWLLLEIPLFAENAMTTWSGRVTRRLIARYDKKNIP